jgi:hypothetical protein
MDMVLTRILTIDPAVPGEGLTLIGCRKSEAL